MTPAETLAAAADKLRSATPAEPAMARAYEPLANLLENAVATAEGLHGIFADSDNPAEFVHPDALAVARAVLGTPEQP